MDADRKLKTDLYLRVCRDSRYMIDPICAAHLVAAMMQCSPFEVLIALGWENMEHIADGSHPATRAS